MNQKQRIVNSNAPLWSSTTGQYYKGHQPDGTLVRIDHSALTDEDRERAKPLPRRWWAPLPR